MVFSLSSCAADCQEDLNGLPELMDTADVVMFDNLGRDDGSEVQLDDESVVLCFMDQCEGSPDDGLGTHPPDGEFGATCVTI